VLLQGSWIFDCGHPEYEAEIHPPTFVAFARNDGNATVSLAFVNPYRVTQLYGQARLATEFPYDSRYSDTGVAPLMSRIKAEVFSAALGEISQLELHPFLEATRFTALTWYVCAPDPKPSKSSSLAYSYRFVARTGVTLSVARRGNSGCLEFHAEMTAAYQPATPDTTDQPWPWAQISADASSQAGTAVDVRQTIIDALAQQGITGDVPALHEDVPPVVGHFASLTPRAGADLDAPTALVQTADDQPFPFYGRVRAYWK